MRIKLLFFSLFFLILFIISALSASAFHLPGTLFCAACSQQPTCGGFRDCLRSNGQVYQESCPACSACTPTSETCGACSASCGTGTRNCTNNCGESYSKSCNNGACPTPTPTPTPSPGLSDSQCQGIGGNCVSSSSQCAPGGLIYGTCTGGRTCCQTSNPDESCLTQGGTCKNNCGPDEVGVGNCSNNRQCCKEQGRIQEACNSQGQWSPTSACVALSTCSPPPPQCNKSKACGSCGVACGNGVQQCKFTEHTTGQKCNEVNFTEPCGQICPPGQSCVANACTFTAEPWIQGRGANLRLDRGFSSKVPTTAVDGPYASLPGSGGTPGIIFSGDSSYDFGQGGASAEPYNWVVGGTTYPETYAPTKIGGVVKTSYNYVLARANQGSITPTDLESYCSGGLGNCSLSTAIPTGVYRATASLKLVGGSYTFPANSNFVILVNGDLTIATKIFVPVGSTVTFSSSGNITIDSNIGEAASSTSSTIEGIYSADRNFIVDGINNCTTGTDLRVNVAGNMILNASLSGGTLQLRRNLCANNRFYPAFSVRDRADFILNTPEFLKQPNFTYQETAP